MDERREEAELARPPCDDESVMVIEVVEVSWVNATCAEKRRARTVEVKATIFAIWRRLDYF
jgi:hypothetical protein